MIKKYIFSDGIGTIDANLLKKIAKQLNANDICAIKCCYKGYKGVLSIGNMEEINKKIKETEIKS